MVWRCATAGRGGWGWWDDGGDAVITVFEGGEGGGKTRYALVRDMHKTQPSHPGIHI
jgi:hypothetical protein